MGQTFWNDEIDAELRRLVVDQRLSMSQAANRLSEKFNRSFTRNSCCGRAWRLKIKANPEATRLKALVNMAKARSATRRSIGSAPKIKYVPKLIFTCESLPLSGPEPLHLALLDLTGSTCRWPLGDGPFTFCGHPSLTSLPYCGAHTRRAIMPPSQRRKAA